MEVFLKNLEKIRLRWKMKKGDLSELMDYNPKAFSAVWNGRVKPSLKMLMKLEVRTGIPIFKLLTQEVNMKEIPKNPMPRDVLETEEGYMVVHIGDKGQMFEDPNVPYESPYQQLERRLKLLEKRVDALTDAIDRFLNQKL